jgi:hypothetical protein
MKKLIAAKTITPEKKLFISHDEPESLGKVGLKTAPGMHLLCLRTGRFRYLDEKLADTCCEIGEGVQQDKEGGPDQSEQESGKSLGAESRDLDSGHIESVGGLDSFARYEIRYARPNGRLGYGIENSGKYADEKEREEQYAGVAGKSEKDDSCGKYTDPPCDVCPGYEFLSVEPVDEYPGKGPDYERGKQCRGHHQTHEAAGAGRLFYPEHGGQRVGLLA